MPLDFSFLIPYVPQLATAARITLTIGVFSFVLALAVSVLVGVLRSGRLPWIVDFLLGVYVEIFRNTPLLIQLFFIYYGLPTFGIVLPPVTAAVIGLSLNSGAYMSEAVRAAISSVNKGQYEAAFSLGYNRYQVFLHIVLPQAFRIALPTLMNYFTTMIKETSLVSVLSIAELTRVGNQIYARTLGPFEIYITIGAVYFVMTYSVALVSRWVEKKGIKWIP
ncbi:amino acid ABC transporter permease [Desulfotignum balticum]|jgi:polar amino acid transport system permease protein|uniref:Glutamate/aspartate import permease protein GltK n=1 Tax=Desulfotignum balticum TaxID=115781 RepID=B2DD63_9BACT|nr:amino acid ABC transporter permease [Desulfotignum balticum]BAG28252.1 permease protein of amino acid ABC transporter [Desulfotignum balticum]